MPAPHRSVFFTGRMPFLPPKQQCQSTEGKWFYIPHTHTFNSPLSRTTRVSQYQKSKTNLDFTEARDSEWQWNPLGRMQVCTSLQADSHTSTPPLSFLQAGCPSCRPTNSVKALWFYIPLDTKWVISETFRQANLLAWYGKKLTLTQQKHAFTNENKHVNTIHNSTE